MAANKWIIGYATRAFNGTGYVCRFLRYMTVAGATGGWAETTDDATD